MNNQWPCSFLLIAALGVPLGCRSGGASTPTFVYVAGFHSGNVVRFDAKTGDGAVLFALPDPGSNEPGQGGSGDRPRGIAVDETGHVYVGLRGGTQNVLRYSPDGQSVENFTDSIGDCGVGLIDLNERGDLLVAGDISENHSLFLHDGLTGTRLLSERPPGVRNLIGIEASGRYVYVLGYFDGTLVKYEFVPGRALEVVFSAETGLSRTSGLAIGHTDNVFVVGHAGNTVVEFDSETGARIGVFASIQAPGELRDIAYDAVTRRYYITTTDTAPQWKGKVLGLDEQGRTRALLEHEQLVGPYGVFVWGPDRRRD